MVCKPHIKTYSIVLRISEMISAIPGHGCTPGVIAAAQVLLDTARVELTKRRERLEDLQARMATEPEPPPSETPPKPKQRAPGVCRWDAGMRLMTLLQSLYI